MVFKWRDNHTSVVLDLLENEECLWNPKTNNYRRKSCREEAVKNIVKRLDFAGLTTEDIKLKIKSIRSRYSAELSKILQSERDGGSEVYKPSLFWFNQADRFLRPVCSPRLSNRSTKVQMKSLGNNEIETDLHTYLEAVCKESIIIEPEKQRDNELHNHSYQQLTCHDESRMDDKKEQVAMKRKHSALVCHRREEISRVPNKSHRSSDELNMAEDEFDLFAKSLAVQLKKMPLERALVCQEKLQKTMTEERLSQLSQPSRESCTCQSNS